MTLPDDWQEWLHDVHTQAWWHTLQGFLEAETAAGKQIYPPANQRFTALECVAPQAVKVVILGQDPYHGPGQAHGLSFSVPHGIATPPSLQNIFKELARDLGHTPPQHGNLLAWAQQGVLLLNTVLTVEADKAGSHRKRGWEKLTDAIISQLSHRREGLVFMLWGAHAQSKVDCIDAQRHLILTSAHPSPLSAYRGFIGNGHFGAANRYLLEQGRAPVEWATT